MLVAQGGVAEQAESQARKALQDGRRLEALAFYEQALRSAQGTAGKARLRDAYIAAGWAEPPRLSPTEERVLADHVRAERLRLYTRAADRFAGGDRIHAAILMRRVVIDLLHDRGPRAKQEKDKIRALIRKLTERPSDEQKELAAKIVRAKRDGRLILKAARKLLAQGEYRVVVRICQEMMFGNFKQEQQNDAIALRKEAEQKASQDIKLEDRNAVKEVTDDPRLERLDVVRSRHFMFLGPKAFTQSIPTDQRTLLDLAYIYQSDLSAQHLTRNGTRICIYYQETFDFGGGLAGGKLIRIGNRAIRLPIAGMLHYHELGHCIFGRGWLHHGFTEGLADFAAGFTLDALGQTQTAQRFIINARDQFVRYFLGRDIRYFDIQPYRPSAGFLFSFLPPGEAPFDWTPYRLAFRRMREAQFGSWPQREHQLMRYFGYMMAAQYGPRVFDRLKEWGWPVEPRDHVLVPPEAEDLLSQAKQGDFKLSKDDHEGAAEHYRRVLKGAPDSPLVPRVLFGLITVANSRGDAARVAELKQRLGILDRYKVLGEYHARRQNRYVVFEPETGRIDTGKPVRFRYETGSWKPARVRYDGFVNLRNQGYGYPAHAVAFALTYVHTDAARKARIWIGSDDGHAVYINDKLAEKRAKSRGFRFDDDFVDIELRPGWNRVLVKVHNTNGAWGFLARITGRTGEPLGLRNAADAPYRGPAPAKWKAVSVVSDPFKSFNRSRWMTTVGRFDTRNGQLRPLSTDKVGLWQRFVVDPDKPKDGPANIIWARSSELAQCADFELELDVAARGKDGLPAKFGFTVDGENQNDGQSGHTFVFDEVDKKLRCHWYRYDKLLFLQQGAPVEPATVYRVRLRRTGSSWRLTVNDTPVFDGADTPRLPASGLGLMTWGKAPHFESVRFSRLSRR